VLVIGCGGVGLAAIQGARLAGAGRIIAADRVAGQLPAAAANGATDTVDAGEADLVAAVRDLTGGAGVDHGIEVVGKPATMRAAYEATRRGGKVTLVGAAGIEEEVTFPALSLMADGKTVQGSVYGASDPARDIPVLAELAQRGRLDLEALVTRRIDIDDVETAFADMAAGRGRAAWSASPDCSAGQRDRPLRAVLLADDGLRLEFARNILDQHDAVTQLVGVVDGRRQRVAAAVPGAAFGIDSHARHDTGKTSGSDSTDRRAAVNVSSVPGLIS
jgi:hypothetical protein